MNHLIDAMDDLWDRVNQLENATSIKIQHLRCLVNSILLDRFFDPPEGDPTHPSKLYGNPHDLSNNLSRFCEAITAKLDGNLPDFVTILEAMIVANDSDSDSDDGPDPPVYHYIHRLIEVYMALVLAQYPPDSDPEPDSPDNVTPAPAPEPSTIPEPVIDGWD